MDTKQLHYFLLVFKTRSICKAANLAHLTQPAISKIIRQLEVDLGVPLFERTSQGVIPTSFAHYLAIHANAIERKILAAQTIISQLKADTEGSAPLKIHNTYLGLNTTQLQHFLAVMETRSINLAADRLGVGRSALNKNIKLLADTLQIRLFDRTPLRIEPTPYAELLVTYVNGIISEIRDTLSGLRILREKEGGCIAVGAGTGIAPFFLPQVLSRLNGETRNGNLKVTIFEGLSEELIPSLIRGELDLAITTSASHTDHTDAELIFETLFVDQVCLVCSKKHPLAGFDLIDVKQILNFPLALAPKIEWQQFLSDVFLNARLSPPQTSVVSSSHALLRSLVLNYNYIAFLPKRLLSIEIEDDLSIVSLPVPNTTLNAEVTLAYRTHAAKLPVTSDFINILREIMLDARGGPVC